MKRKKEKSKILINGEEREYEVLKHPLSKKIRLKVSGDGKIKITLPERLSFDYAHSFLKKNKEWVEKHLKSVGTKNSLLKDWLFEGFILYHGEKRNLFILPDPKIKQSKLEYENQSFYLKVPAEHTKESVYEAVKKGLIRMAKTEFSALLEKMSRITGIYYLKLTIKDTRTRWGSCSSKRSINLSWRLIMAPASVQTYLVIHELSHLREMNHSKKFWDWIEAYLPDYREQELYLKNEGWKLHTF